MATKRRRKNREKKVEATAKEFEKAPEKVLKVPVHEKKQTKETTFRDRMDKLSPERKAKIEANGKKLIKEELAKRKKPKYLYRQILPHEIEGLIPLIKDFYKAINYKEATDNPLPFIAQINREMVSNPYSIIYACVDQQLKPQGYMWFRVDVNPLGQKYIHIEHDYVIPELRHTFTEARIHREFINYVIEVAERNNTQYVTTCVRSTDLEKSRKKLGFKSVEVKMTFKGTAEDFRAENPSFYKFYKTDEVE